MLQPVLVTVQGMVDWSMPVIMRCVGAKANVLLNVSWVDTAPYCTCTAKKNVNQEEKISSNVYPQVLIALVGYKTSSFSRSRCLRQGLHCTQEACKVFTFVQPARAKQVSISCRTHFWGFYVNIRSCVRGRTEDAASNWLRIFPKQTKYKIKKKKTIKNKKKKP